MMKKINIPPFIICVAFISAIGAMTFMYGDDLIYGTYFLGGFKNFLRLTAYHYNELNGRLFVHFILEIVLFFRDKLFFAVVPSMTLAAFFTLSKALGMQNKRLYFCTLGLAGVMCLSPYLLREGMLWMAGAFNYIFPVSFAAAAFYAIKTVSDDNCAKIWYFPICFLCGASTEQCAVIAVSAGALYIFNRFFKYKKINMQSILLTAFIFVGLLTIMLSPGTSKRADREAVNGAADIIRRLKLLYSLALKDFGILWVFISALLIFPFRKKYITAAAVAAELILCFLKMYLVGGILLTAMLLICACRLFKEKTEYSCLLFASLLSIGMMVLADSFGRRNYLPAILIILSLCAGAVTERFGENTPLIFSAVAAAALVFMPTLCGYAVNRQIINENIRNLEKADGERYYNADINPVYGYYQFFADSFYMDGIKKIYHLNENDKIFIRGKDFEDLYINGIHSENPKYIKNNTEFYPMRNVLEIFGADISYSNETKQTQINLNGEVIYYDGSVFFKNGTEIKAERLNDPTYGNMFNSNIYLSKETYAEVFGISFDKN